MPMSPKELEACIATILRAFDEYRAASDQGVTNFMDEVLHEMARIAETLAETTAAQESATDTAKSDGRGQHVQRPLLSGQRNASVEKDNRILLDFKAGEVSNAKGSKLWNLQQDRQGSWWLQLKAGDKWTRELLHDDSGYTPSGIRKKDIWQIVEGPRTKASTHDFDGYETRSNVKRDRQEDNGTSGEGTSDAQGTERKRPRYQSRPEIVD